MAESRRYDVGAQLDIEQILLEAQHRWLRPAEICEILQNYKKFRIAPEPANKPQSGSLFLFDRKVLRYFRKDGHNWRKKKDGKTVKEAHERLKAGSIDVLHCYYAHGEENENFQRRSYWLLEEELSHIVLVHYREVKGSRTNFNRIGEAEEAIPNLHENLDNLSNSDVDGSASSKFHPFNYHDASQVTDTSLNSAQSSEHEDAESAYNNQSSSGFHSFLALQPSIMERMGNRLAIPYPTPLSDDYQGKFSAITGMEFASLPELGKENHNNGSLTYESEKLLHFPSWENVLGNITAENHSGNFQPSLLPSQRGIMSRTPGEGNETIVQVSSDDLCKKQEFGNHAQGQELWQTSAGESSYISKWSVDPKLYQESPYCLPGRFHEEDYSVDLLIPLDPGSVDSAEKSKHAIQNNLQGQLIHAERGSFVESDLNSNPYPECKVDSSGLKQPFLDGILREGLKKLDSFDRWMSKELGDVNESHMQPSSGAYWETVGSEGAVLDSSIAPEVHLDSYVLGPSLSQDQLFSIIDFSPNWAYAGSEIKVLIMGRFLKNKEDVEKCKWACMFGELEVPAEVIADGVLRCYTPPHRAERVPFYVTCSNRLSCSEVREFEYRVSEVQDVDDFDINSGNTNEALLHIQFGKLLSLGSASSENPVSSGVGDDSSLSCKINSLIEDVNEWDNMLKTTREDQFSPEKVQERLLQKLLKEKLHAWLLRKVAEGGKGPSVLNEGGQGVLHFAAALGYDWAIQPIVAAGVNINFRDINGWTALHWAASCGRERTVGFLISLGAAPGALTDPTPKYPSGSTPADLASRNGHKGIAGFLAESALSTHLSSLKLKDIKQSDDNENSRLQAVQMVLERTATPITDGDLPGLSLKDSLAAVRNATQAAARIHQVYRVQSFQKKQLKGYGGGEFGMSDERALSLIAVKPNRTGQYYEPAHAAAIRIQNKFRGWKGRREFLTIRQRIVKIQAHVRGHQVRKNYKKIIWSVGILEKVILRWRRKGSGLRGFKSEAVTEGPSMQNSLSKDDYDFLKEGRRQTEVRLQKALDRVKSMVQYPEARDQYRRLLNLVSEIQETKAVSDGALDSSNEPVDFDGDLINLEALLDDDILMPDEY